MTPARKPPPGPSGAYRWGYHAAYEGMPAAWQSDALAWGRALASQYADPVFGHRLILLCYCVRWVQYVQALRNRHVHWALTLNDGHLGLALKLMDHYPASQRAYMRARAHAGRLASQALDALLQRLEELESEGFGLQRVDSTSPQLRHAAPEKPKTLAAAASPSPCYPLQQQHFDTPPNGATAIASAQAAETQTPASAPPSARENPSQFPSMSERLPPESARPQTPSRLVRRSLGEGGPPPRTPIPPIPRPTLVPPMLYTPNPLGTLNWNLLWMRSLGYLSLLGFCAFLRAQPPAPAEPPSDLQKAAGEFKTLTRDQGFREDSPRKAARSSGRSAQFHGRLYENFRNDFLDAVPHEIVQRGGDKNLLRRNQFGFNVSGPVVIPKLFRGERSTFFSLSYEGVRERISRSYLRTVARPDERTGGFSQTVDSSGAPLQIFDPSSTRLNPAFNPALDVSRDNLQYVKDPYPANVIPSSRLDPVALNALAYYPVPNASAGPFFRNNYFIVSPETNTANGMIAKVDHSFLEKHRLAVSYAFTNGLSGAARYIDGPADSAPADHNYQNRRGSLEHVFTLSPQTINTATFEAHGVVSENVADPSGWPEKLGLSGAAGSVFPRFDMANYMDMGRPSPIARTARNTFVFTEAFSHKRGPHNFRYVSQFVRHQVNTFLPGVPAGAFYFGATYTSLPGIVNTGLPFASFLLGGPESSDMSLVPSPSYFRNWTWINALQDTWEVRSNLTLSFGLNMLAAAPRSERYDRQSVVDLRLLNPANQRPGALVFAGRGGYGHSFQPEAVKPQPNFSLAWNPRGNRKSVARLSYGMSYQAYPVYSGQWGTRGFTGHPYYNSPNAQLAPAFNLRDGIPTPPRPVPDLTPTAANDTHANVVDTNARLPRYQSAGLSYEREIPGAFVLTGSLGLAWGRDLFVSNSVARLNAVHPDFLSLRDRLNDLDFNRSLRPYPQFLEIDLFSQWPEGRYRREAGSLRLEKRTSQGLSLSATYEYSRQFDDYSGPYGRQDQFNRKNDWALTAYNNPHRLSLSYMYELPFGANKPFFNYPDWRRFLSGGWSVSGITSVASGEPLALRAQFNNTGGVLNTVRVNVVPGVDPRSPNQGPDQWFNPAAFSHPADFEMGSGPRTHPFLRGPISQNHDLSVAKRFPIDLDRSVEFTASGFNFLNHANWSDPDVVIGAESAPNANAGRIIGSRGSRVIQLGLRFSF